MSKCQNVKIISCKTSQTMIFPFFFFFIKNKHFKVTKPKVENYFYYKSSPNGQKYFPGEITLFPKTQPGLCIMAIFLNVIKHYCRICGDRN